MVFKSIIVENVPFPSGCKHVVDIRRLVFPCQPSECAQGGALLPGVPAVGRGGGGPVPGEPALVGLRGLDFFGLRFPSARPWLLPGGRLASFTDWAALGNCVILKISPLSFLSQRSWLLAVQSLDPHLAESDAPGQVSRVAFRRASEAGSLFLCVYGTLPGGPC